MSLCVCVCVVCLCLRLCVCLCVNVSLCLYVCVCVWVSVYASLCVHLSVQLCVFMCLYLVCVCVPLCVSVYVCVSVCVYVCACVCMCVCVSVCVCMHACATAPWRVTNSRTLHKMCFSLSRSRGPCVIHSARGFWEAALRSCKVAESWSQGEECLLKLWHLRGGRYTGCPSQETAPGRPASGGRVCREGLGRSRKARRKLNLPQGWGTRSLKGSLWLWPQLPSPGPGRLRWPGQPQLDAFTFKQTRRSPSSFLEGLVT